jgi:tRNA (cmo5U34)-methyltransferase
LTEKPSVSSHLKIPLEEYDARIRTFIPFYEEMLGEVGKAVSSLAADDPTILDLGIGTGALAEVCLKARPEGRLIGIDSDPEILEMARLRFRDRPGLDLRVGSFLELDFPRSDLIVASFSLHHVPQPEIKKDLFVRCREALGETGSLVMADCFPSADEEVAEEGRRAWGSHLERFYSPEETRAYFAAWAEEDTHFSLPAELDWLEGAGFRPTVVWRKDLFAVLLCT